MKKKIKIILEYFQKLKSKNLFKWINSNKVRVKKSIVVSVIM